MRRGWRWSSARAMEKRARRESWLSSESSLVGLPPQSFEVAFELFCIKKLPSRAQHALMQWTALECFGCAPSCESPLTSPLAAARYHVLKHSRKYHLQDTSAYVNRVCSRVASRVGTISSREVDACASVDYQARSKATAGSRAAQDHIVARYTLVAVTC